MTTPKPGYVLHGGDRHETPSGPRAGASLADLAERQGVRPVEHLQDLLGGWPSEEIDDGFEAAVVEWRRRDRESAVRK